MGETGPRKNMFNKLCTFALCTGARGIEQARSVWFCYALINKEGGCYASEKVEGIS